MSYLVKYPRRGNQASGNLGLGFSSKKADALMLDSELEWTLSAG